MLASNKPLNVYSPVGASSSCHVTSTCLWSQNLSITSEDPLPLRAYSYAPALLPWQPLRGLLLRFELDASLSVLTRRSQLEVLRASAAKASILTADAQACRCPLEVRPVITAGQQLDRCEDLATHHLLVKRCSASFRSSA